MVMTRINTTISYKPEDAKIVEEAKRLLTINGLNLSSFIMVCLKKYLTEHGDGNDSYTIDHFMDENFIATPALFRDKDTILKFVLDTFESPIQNKRLEQQRNTWIDIFNAVQRGKVA